MVRQNFDTFYGIEPGSHLYQFYKNFQDYIAIMSSFMAAGLKRGDACIWLIDEAMGIAKATQAASRKIQNWNETLASGRLQILSANDWYLHEDQFDEERTLDHAVRVMEETLKKGYQCLRIAGDANVIPHEQWGKIINYEHRVQELLKNLPVIAVCAYPIRSCSLSDTCRIVDAHDHAMVGHLSSTMPVR